MLTGIRRPGSRTPGAGALVLLVAIVLAGCAGATAPAAPALPAAVPPTFPADGRVVPVSLHVPAIGVDEDTVQSLGVAPDGTAEVPQDFGRVGWFDPARGDPVPGARGPTVLLGHVDSRAGPAVFYRLRDLRPGDVVEVGVAGGEVARYVVARTEQVAKDRFPTFAVFGATPDDVLRLVTCAGAFDRGARSYTDNLVVHAVRV
ncbi:class F sortase [Actinomycetospora cinnamomea]|uniref:Sortase family protein n=1 Tax=Actinomycetospora cinnamomea TaxID=663609 RepID=A0A2U1FRP3_9PSEU|nr:class F sortase [Actinomycetospora cinnamomea]PVZ14845.1 sortase family protein [Actinomycetospora cinnamomea]